MRPNKKNKRKINKPQKRKSNEKEILNEYNRVEDSTTCEKHEEEFGKIPEENESKGKLRVRFVNKAPQIKDLTTETVKEEELPRGKRSSGVLTVKSMNVRTNGKKYEDDPDWVVEVLDDIKEDFNEVNGNVGETNSTGNSETEKQGNKAVKLSKNVTPGYADKENSAANNMASIWELINEGKEDANNGTEEPMNPCVVMKRETLEEIEAADEESMQSLPKEHEEETTNEEVCNSHDTCYPSESPETGGARTLSHYPEEGYRNANGLDLLADAAEFEYAKRKRALSDQEDAKQKEKETPPTDTAPAPEQTKMTNEAKETDQQNGVENSQMDTAKVGMHDGRRQKEEKEAKEVVQLDNTIRKLDGNSTVLTKRSKDLQDKGVTIVRMEPALVITKVYNRELEKAKRRRMDVMLNRRDKITSRDTGSFTILPRILYDLGIKQDEPGRVLAPGLYEEVIMSQHITEICATPRISTFLRLVGMGLMTIMREHPEFQYAVQGLNSCLASKQVGIHDGQIQAAANAMGLDLPLNMTHTGDQQGVYLACSLLNVSTIGVHELSRLRYESP